MTVMLQLAGRRRRLPHVDIAGITVAGARPTARIDITDITAVTIGAQRATLDGTTWR